MRTYVEIFKDMQPFLLELAERAKVQIELRVSEKEFDKFGDELKLTYDYDVDSEQEKAKAKKMWGGIHLIHDRVLDEKKKKSG